jgi:SAM-dependent methyltransferase
LCESSVKTYLPHGGGFEVLERRKVVGGKLREQDQCPVCRSADRTRLMMLYLDKILKISEQPAKILHVAPDFGLYLWLKRKGVRDYIAADLDLARYRHIENIQKVNLTQIPFEQGIFDVLICSHVLEHVPDDQRAMREILRVLKPGGTAMLMVPLAHDGLGTEEAPSINDPQEQERRFGQSDHVRIYSREDFIKRLENNGFTVATFNGFVDFPDEASAMHLNPDETLVIARKL